MKRGGTAGGRPVCCIEALSTSPSWNRIGEESFTWWSLVFGTPSWRFAVVPNGLGRALNGRRELGTDRPGGRGRSRRAPKRQYEVKTLRTTKRVSRMRDPPERVRDEWHPSHLDLPWRTSLRPDWCDGGKGREKHHTVLRTQILLVDYTHRQGGSYLSCAKGEKPATPIE